MLEVHSEIFMNEIIKVVRICFKVMQWEQEVSGCTADMGLAVS